ncbi:DUF3515 domain-containing protein [Nocardia sp. NPDC059195]|uniref:DUF3515 domain-containing protein n=1 Tax=Nocardia sp. NPDC059195 TaxID=3346765 RepID=UPI00369D74AA
MADSTPEDRDEATAPDDTATTDAKSPVDKPASAANTDAAAQQAAADPTDARSAASTTPGDVDATAVNPGADTDTEDADSDTESHHSPALIATAVALPVVLIVAVLVAAFIALRAPVEREPLALGPVPAPAADGPACQALLPALPADLGDHTKATLVEPAPPATRAWQLPDGGDPITLRCGLDRPLEFNRASPLTVIDGVKWFQVRDEVGKTGTWFAVDRETYIALTVPDGSGTSALQTVSETINANLPAREPTPGEL